MNELNLMQHPNCIDSDFSLALEAGTTAKRGSFYCLVSTVQTQIATSGTRKPVPPDLDV